MSALCDYELKVLRILDGQEVPEIIYGAGLMAAIEFLQGSGHIKRTMISMPDIEIGYSLTDKGREVIGAKISG
jgi:hypothetical protein